LSFVKNLPPLCAGFQEQGVDYLGDWIKEIVLKEVDELTDKHKAIDAPRFNNDKKYKRLTTEAIDAKTMALKKINFFKAQAEQECRSGHFNIQFLERIADRPFMDWAHPSTELELETGDSGFPWKQVLGADAHVDFKLWRPEGMSEQNRRVMINQIAENRNVRLVQVEVNKQTAPLQVPQDGWSSSSISWKDSLAVRNAPGIINMLLQCFDGLEELNLRYSSASNSRGLRMGIGQFGALFT
jgi:hypothetical protein